MFGLFKRTKIEAWEIELLKNIFSKIPEDIGKRIYRQVESGLLRDVSIRSGGIPNYVGFKYNPSLYYDFYDAKGKNYKLSNILVKDSFSAEYLPITIYIGYEMINGYSIDKNVSKYKFDVNDVNIGSMHKVYIGEYNTLILSLLTKQERDVINESDIYETTLNNKDYYHLKELEDGDFVGIDKNNNIYKITHDPFEITPLERSKLIEILQRNIF
jgi:hypothetical protein